MIVDVEIYFCDNVLKRVRQKKTLLHFDDKIVGVGGMKITYDCVLEGSSNKTVCKIYKPEFTKNKDARDLYWNDFKVQSIARECSQKFSKITKREISFLQPYFAKCKQKLKFTFGKNTYYTDYLIIEPKLKSENFTKFCNNVGQVFNMNDVAHAFVHFSYLYSHKQYIISDIQGVVCGKKLYCTDPIMNYNKKVCW